MARPSAQAPFRHLWHVAGALLCAALLTTGPAAAREAYTPHPLDPLSEVEIARAVEVITQSGRLSEPTRAVTITLHEPHKATVLAWKPGASVRRQAAAVLRVGRATYEAVVDLASGTISRWTHVPRVQPAIQSAEWALAQSIVKSDPRWQEAMQKRGYFSFDDIFCEALSAGYFGTPGEDARRLLKMPCYDVSGARVNVYARPIEGLIATVDLDAGAMIDLLDEGVVPVHPTPHEFGEASVQPLVPPMRPVRTTAPAGWNFKVAQRMVAWHGWSFHLGFDQRFGPVISLVKHQDGGRERMILYQGHISEIFVPYMHDAPSWAFRAYLDAGEFGLGTLASPLAAGTDCPETAVFLDATLPNSAGHAYSRERVLCIFERDPSAPLWRHHEALTGAAESRPATELVVRSISSIAHYDYVFDWVFTQAGTILVRIGATGIDSVQGLDLQNSSRPESPERHGAEVAPGLRAINHDHYFSLRLDLDIDGRVNRFIRERLIVTTSDAGGLQRSFWEAVPEAVEVETALTSSGVPEIWRVENPHVTVPPNQRPAYQVEGCGPVSLLRTDDWAQRRAAFSGSDLWVTRQRVGELFAAGPYPNQSRGGDGLAAYVDDEPILSADLVAWCTIGIRHVTRPEDWPVLTTIWREIALRPYGFFSRNPAVGVRREFLDTTP